MMMMLMVISSNVGFIGALPAGRGYLRGYMFLFSESTCFWSEVICFCEDMIRRPSLSLPGASPLASRGQREVGVRGEEGRRRGEFAPEIRGSVFPLHIWVRDCKRFGERVGRVGILFGRILIFVICCNVIRIDVTEGFSPPYFKTQKSHGHAATAYRLRPIQTM